MDKIRAVECRRCCGVRESYPGGFLSSASSHRQSIMSWIGRGCRRTAFFWQSAFLHASIQIKVEGFYCRVGDAVFGQVMGGMASHVIADPQTLVRQPPNISAVQAATIPTAFLTAYECLMVAAKIQRGSCALIHAATGSLTNQ